MEGLRREKVSGRMKKQKLANRASNDFDFEPILYKKVGFFSILIYSSYY